MHQNSLSKLKTCPPYIRHVHLAYLVDALWVFIYDVIMMSEFFKVL